MNAITDEHMLVEQAQPPVKVWSRLHFQAGSKLAAEVFGRLLQFALIYAVQRTLGPAGYGLVTYGLAIGVVLAPLTDLGMELIITREIARDESTAQRIAGAGLLLKLLLTLGAVGLLLPFSLSRPSDAIAATFLLALAVVGASFTEYFGYVFRGLRRVELDAAFTLLQRICVFGFGLTAVLLHAGVIGVALAYFAGDSLTALLGYLWLRRRFFNPVLRWQLAEIVALLRQAWPLGGAILLSLMYTRSAIFLLDAFQGSGAVGVYGVAQRLTEPLALIPAAIMAAVFPALTRDLTQRGYRSTRVLRARTIGLLAAAGLLVALGGVIGGPWLIRFLYRDQYVGTAPALQVLALATLPIFVNYALTHFLVALGWQRLNLIFNAIVFVMNLALCWLLIPRWGPGGAALAAAISEVILLLLCGAALSRAARQRAR